MYNKISFKEHSDYFFHSNIFNEFKIELDPNDPKNTDDYQAYFFPDNFKVPEELVNYTIQFFMENIIKHNFNVRVAKKKSGMDHLLFLSEDNSQEVLDKFEEIQSFGTRNMMKPHKTEEQEKLESAIIYVYERVLDKICDYILIEKHKKNRDLCENMKEEFGVFMENKYTSKATSHNRHKP